MRSLWIELATVPVPQPFVVGSHYRVGIVPGHQAGLYPSDLYPEGHHDLVEDHLLVAATMLSVLMTSRMWLPKLSVRLASFDALLIRILVTLWDQSEMAEPFQNSIAISRDWKVTDCNSHDHPRWIDLILSGLST